MLVGIDIVDVERFEKLVENEAFFEKFFTAQEREYVLSRVRPAESMAGIFAGKEAFLKALGIGIGRGIDLKDIEISHNELGKPFYILENDRISSGLSQAGVKAGDISISHTDKMATAICILY